jgi:hypothetical protein
MFEINLRDSNLCTIYSDFSTFECIPDELIQKIFLSCTPKDLQILLQVSKRFRVIAEDGRIWKIFCQSLPHASGEYFKKDCNFHLLYQHMRSIPENIQNNRFSLKESSYPKDTLFFALSENAICLLRYSMKIEIYDPENGQLIQHLDPKPPNSDKLLRLVNKLSSFKNLLEDYKAQKISAADALTCAKRLRKKIAKYADDQEVVFFYRVALFFWLMPLCMFTQDNAEFVLARLSNLIPKTMESVNSFLDASLCHFSSFEATEADSAEKLYDLNPISCFAASAHHYAVGYISGYIDIWECDTGNKICTLNKELFASQTNFKFALFFFGRQILILEKNSGTLLKIDWEKRAIYTSHDWIQAKFLEKIDEEYVLAAEESGNVYILNSKSLVTEKSLHFNVDKLNGTSIDRSTKNIVFWDKSPAKNFLWGGVLNPQFSFNCLTFNGEMDSFHSAHRSIWIEYKGGVIKMNPPSKISKILPPDSKMKTPGSSFWHSNKLFLYSHGKKVHTLDYCTIEKEILLEVIQDLQKEKDATYISMRLENLSKKHREGILFCFDLFYNNANSKSYDFFASAWGKASSEEKIETLKFYMEHLTEIVTNQGRQILKGKVEKMRKVNYKHSYQDGL